MGFVNCQRITQQVGTRGGWSFHCRERGFKVYPTGDDARNAPKEYSHTGKDQNGRDVSRDNLMGYGSGLRQFYFDLWNNWSMSCVIFL